MGFWDALDRLLAESDLIIDRPKGSRHPRHPGIVYRLDYGYLKDTASQDGDGIDVLLGSEMPRRVTGVVCTVDLMQRDSEIKVLVGCTAGEMADAARFFNEQGLQRGLLVSRDG